MKYLDLLCFYMNGTELIIIVLLFESYTALKYFLLHFHWNTNTQAFLVLL